MGEGYDGGLYFHKQLLITEDVVIEALGSLVGDIDVEAL